MDNFDLKTYLVENKLTKNSLLVEFTLPELPYSIQSEIDKGVDNLMAQIPNDEKEQMKKKAIETFGENGEGLKSIVDKANIGNIADKLPSEDELNEVLGIGNFFKSIWKKFTSEFRDLDAIIGSFAGSFITVAVTAYQNALKVKPVEMGLTAFTVFFFATFLVTFIYTLIKDKF